MRQLQPLAITNITPYIVPVPRGIDMVCKSLQRSFDGIEWLEKSFARAVYRSKTIEGGSEYIYPAVFVEDGYDYLDLMNLDNWKSYSFMLAKDNEKVVDYQEEVVNTMSRTLSCVFWMNLEKIDPNRYDDFLEELKQDVVKAIKSTRFLDTTNNATVYGVNVLNIFDEPDNIFEGFSQDITANQSLYYPYKGLRIDLEALYSEECINQ